MTNVNLLSFADKRYSSSLHRLDIQSHDFNFSKKFLFNEDNLDGDFRKICNRFLNHRTRGFGFWCWKPQVILQVLDEIPAGEIILYLDAGCHLNKNGMARFYDYIRITELSNSGILAFQAYPPNSEFLAYDGRNLPDLSEFKWTKADLFKFFNVHDNLDITHSPTFGAGIIFIRKTPLSIMLIKSWRDTFINNFSLIDDSPSQFQNFPGFIEHRFDQSIFSIIAKLNNVDSISAYEYWYPTVNSKGIDWEALGNLPIHVRRDLNTNIVHRCKKFYIRLMNFLIKKFINLVHKFSI